MKRNKDCQASFKELQQAGWQCQKFFVSQPGANRTVWMCFDNDESRTDHDSPDWVCESEAK